MAQDNAEMSTKFSTLNVNAAEFVPSFTSFSAAASTALSTENTTTPAAAAATTPIAAMDTASVPASTSGTPATTPNSEASGSGSINALNQNAADVPPADSPMQTSPIKTAAAAAPVENINTADKIAANNGNGKYRDI